MSYPCSSLIASPATQTVQDSPKAGPSSLPMDVRPEDSALEDVPESGQVYSMELPQASSTALSTALKNLEGLAAHHRIAISLEQDFLRVIEAKISAAREQMELAKRREAKGKWRED